MMIGERRILLGQCNRASPRFDNRAGCERAREHRRTLMGSRSLRRREQIGECGARRRLDEQQLRGHDVGLALRPVPERGLAGLGGVEVEDVVDDLEADAGVAPDRRERDQLLVLDPRDPSGQPRAQRKECASSSTPPLRGMLGRRRAARRGARTAKPRRRPDPGSSTRLPQYDRNTLPLSGDALHYLGEDAVASKHRDRVVELRVRGGPMATRIGAVHDVVVEEGSRQMDELDRQRVGPSHGVVESQGPTEQRHDQRPDHLAG